MIESPRALLLPLSDERRRHQRVRVALLGRFMLEDRREFPCQTINMSPGGVAISAPVIARVGERVVAYLDHVGRIEGVVVRQFDSGFAVSIWATLRRRDKLADQLTWLANRQLLGLPEDRRHERTTPRDTLSTVTFPDGTEINCRVIDVSLSGAAVASDLRPAIGTIVMLGKTKGTVVRHIEQGFAVEFARGGVDESDAEPPRY
ncbi:MAG: pilus assembly protein PilZ [Xanthobacteraceae bacterium]|jgi:hypothetical protein|nr:pilus assembly protein PilZ [Xanthobacteraceae bacterium]